MLFPLAMYFRLHFPGQVLVAAMTPVTMGLVIGEPNVSDHADPQDMYVERGRAGRR